MAAIFAGFGATRVRIGIVMRPFKTGLDDGKDLVATPPALLRLRAWCKTPSTAYRIGVRLLLAKVVRRFAVIGNSVYFALCSANWRNSKPVRIWVNPRWIRLRRRKQSGAVPGASPAALHDQGGHGIGCT
jgi:hypothetical protein